MQMLLAHCSAVFTQHGNVLVMFFLAGLTGSLTHCLAMCGPVVACQAACGGACGTKFRNASQWPYHVGRLITYSALGFAAALVSKQVAAYSFWPALSTAMLLLAAALFLLSSLVTQRHRMMKWVPQSPFLRGMLMGFMPCGLIYAALMVAATLTNPVYGALAMASFVAGTTPALLLASTGSALLARKWNGFMGGLGRVGMAWNGLSLLVIAAEGMR